MSRFRRYYGAQPLHLLAVIASFALVGLGVAGWLQPGSDVRGILTWLVACAVAFELVLLPLAWLVDRIALGWPRGGARRRRAPRAGRAYVRVPALLSGLLLVVFLPLIFKLGTSTYVQFDGSSPSGYLVRWLVATGALFSCSGLLYAIGLLRPRRRGRVVELAPGSGRSANAAPGTRDTKRQSSITAPYR